MPSLSSIELFTIGHSNHSREDFLNLLKQHAIEAVADVRRFPGSRKYPHFNQDELSQSLQDIGIEYLWIEELGGRRPKAKNFESPNTGLRNESFRNYADYMLTEDFREGIGKLAEIAAEKRTAILCAESVFWRCHRRLVSDFVLAQGGRVQHIFPSGDSKPHSLTAEARVENETVTYPGERTLFE